MRMVYRFFSIHGSDWLIYMGRDKFENEELLKWGWPEDVWFHAENLSSAHVYLRIPSGSAFDLNSIPGEILEDVCQTVKANSIQGSKMESIRVNYTMWSNLLKTKGMEVGAVSYKSRKQVNTRKVSKDSDIWNRLKKTKEEFEVDLEKERKNRDREENMRKVEQEKANAKLVEEEKRMKQELKEARQYRALDKEQAVTNKTKKNLEDDFW